jgi:competence protein ComEA
MSPAELPKPPADQRWPPLLRRADQAAVAVLTLAGLIGMTVYTVVQSRQPGRWIEIDRAEPLEARFIVDLNTADWPELAQLPDIGETLARRIVEVRQTGGPFLDHADLRHRVQGIGPRTLERIKPYLRPIPPVDHIARE